MLSSLHNAKNRAIVVVPLPILLQVEFSDDSSYCLLCSLEDLNEDGTLKRKADMFTKRTIKKAVAVTCVETATEALALSLNERAKVDLPYMAKSPMVRSCEDVDDWKWTWRYCESVEV